MNRAHVGASIPKERDGPHWGGAFAPETNRPAQVCPQGLGWALARIFSRVGRALLENLIELPQAEIILAQLAGCHGPEHREGEAGEPRPVTEGGERDPLKGESPRSWSHPQESPEPLTVLTLERLERTM